MLKRLSIAERAYLAGILDGEGSIGIRWTWGARSKTMSLRIVVRVYNTDERLIRWIAARFHGSIVCAKQKLSKNSNHKPVWQWSAHSNNAVPILEAALPYLVLKREQAELSLEAATLILPPTKRRSGVSLEMMERRTDFRNKVIRLNKRGVA